MSASCAARTEFDVLAPPPPLRRRRCTPGVMPCRQAAADFGAAWVQSVPRPLAEAERNQKRDGSDGRECNGARTGGATPERSGIRERSGAPATRG